MRPLTDGGSPGGPGGPGVERRLLSSVGSMDVSVRRILIIDDEPRVGELLYRMLERRYAVLVESDARRALGLMESGVGFDVVLSDLGMAPMSGMELFARVQRCDPALAERFLFMTGDARASAEVERFLAAWPHEYLSKPFVVRELERQIEKTLARTRSAVAPPAAAEG